MFRDSPESDFSSHNEKRKIPVGRKILRPELRDFLPPVENPRQINATLSYQRSNDDYYQYRQQSQNRYNEQPLLPTPPSVKTEGDSTTFTYYSEPEHDHSTTFIAEEMSTNINDVYIVSALRTPITSFRGSLKILSSVDLGVIVTKELLKRNEIKVEEVDEIITGSVLTANCGQNVSRQIGLKSGLPETINAFTVNKVCSSSLKALILGIQSIQLGVNKVSLIIGTESMSQTPYYLNRGDNVYGDIKLIDGIQKDGLTDAILNDAMGLCAEKTVKELNITREEQDKYALESYKNASEAWKNGKYDKEVVPVIIKNKNGTETIIKEDEEYKKLIESKVPLLKPAFSKDGTITAANASSLNDGAAGAVIVSGSVVNDYHPLAKIIGYSEAGRLPVDFTLAPVNAVKKLLNNHKLTVNDISKFEVNEAFSVTAISFMKELNIDRNKINCNGGAVALGHPIGMSGIRIVTTLVHQLNSGEYGIAAICNGGGEATALLIQKV